MKTLKRILSRLIETNRIERLFSKNKFNIKATPEQLKNLGIDGFVKDGDKIVFLTDMYKDGYARCVKENVKTDYSGDETVNIEFDIPISMIKGFKK